MNYGLPYMGSKNRIANWVINNLPEADNLYDLFGGGGAVTHCAALSGKYKNIYYNDIQKNLTKLFKDAMNGKYKNENRWISREEFNDPKNDNDMYIKLCWSFGNKCVTYLYGKDREPFKKAWHYAVFFDDYSLFEKLNIHINHADVELTTKEKRLYIKKELDKIRKQRNELQSLESLERLESLESLERFQSLERLERLQSLESLESNIIFSEKSYDKFTIKPNSIIYCDIPYKGTEEYSIKNFDYDKFYDWCEKQTVPIYISEYSMPEDRFICIAEKETRNILSATINKKSIEKIWRPKCQLEA